MFIKEKEAIKKKNGCMAYCESPYADCPNEPFTIPVVFHIVYNPDEDTFLDDNMIKAALAELNQYFAGTHSLQDSINPIFLPSFSGDTNLKFVLAAVDPWGNPHSGINRRVTQAPYFRGNNPVKNLYSNFWPSSSFFKA